MAVINTLLYVVELQRGDNQLMCLALSQCSGPLPVIITLLKVTSCDLFPMTESH